ncbi:MAG TPA: hypothetical protein VHH88_00480, partial [Verrucomicrobiae bacterium]|nr:hypothetical protein [Verrucomicrobiae bacterium]
MNRALLEEIVQAVLYEGYILYPYRPSSRKNRRERFTFGRVYPEAYSRAQNGAEPCFMQTECLARVSGHEARVQVAIRFLQPMARDMGVVTERRAEFDDSTSYELVPELRVNGEALHSWHEAVEREVRQEIELRLAPAGNAGKSSAPVSPREPLRIPFAFPAAHSVEPVRDENKLVAG